MTAWTALALVLLVPARALALCCVEALSEPAVGAHGEAHHAAGSHGEAQHAAEHGDAEGVELSAESGAGDCGSIDALAPAVRERGPAGSGPATFLAPTGPSAVAPELRATAHRPASARAIRPLSPELVSLRI